MFTPQHPYLAIVLLPQMMIGIILCKIGDSFRKNVSTSGGDSSVGEGETKQTGCFQCVHLFRCVHDVISAVSTHLLCVSTFCGISLLWLSLSLSIILFILLKVQRKVGEGCLAG
jgi:hypothetical protein